ncbi:hypothetical protein F6Y04_01100 [Bacillus megaterium]|nr:hypothetical protein [Priestia megaterium]
MAEYPEQVLPNDRIAAGSWVKEVAAEQAVHHHENQADRQRRNANKISADATNVAHVNIGMRINVMPGARMLMIVTRKLDGTHDVPKPEICSPSV